MRPKFTYWYEVEDYGRVEIKLETDPVDLEELDIQACAEHWCNWQSYEDFGVENMRTVAIYDNEEGGTLYIKRKVQIEMEPVFHVY